MQGFKKRYSEKLKLTRGGESVTLKLTVPPTGWQGLLAVRWPDSDMDEKHVQLEQNIVWVAKFLEPSGVLDAGRVPEDPEEWRDYAATVSAELGEAGINDSDMLKIQAACRSVIRNARPDDPEAITRLRALNKRRQACLPLEVAAAMPDDPEKAALWLGGAFAALPDVKEPAGLPEEIEAQDPEGNPSAQDEAA